MPDIVMERRLIIPGWVKDHESYRRWAVSGGYPERGQIAYLSDRVWVDLTMERQTHNFLKMAIGSVLMMLVQRKDLGEFYGDRMLLSYPDVVLSTEPDGMYISWGSLENGSVRVIGGDPEDGVEIVGAPDMVLEIVSPGSVEKDTEELLSLYWQAGISEYWLVNPVDRKVPQFNVFARGADGYRAVRPVGGWRKSAVFGQSFRLVTATNRRGRQTYSLETR